MSNSTSMTFGSFMAAYGYVDNNSITDAKITVSPLGSGGADEIPAGKSVTLNNILLCIDPNVTFDVYGSITASSPQTSPTPSYRSEILNLGTVHNYGTILVDNQSGTNNVGIQNGDDFDPGKFYNSSGYLEITKGVFYNNELSVVSNSGTTSRPGEIVILNSELSNNTDAEFTNSANGIVRINSYSELKNYSTLTNNYSCSLEIATGSTLENDISGILTNKGTLTINTVASGCRMWNKGTIKNEGTLNIYGTVLYDSFSPIDGGGSNAKIKIDAASSITDPNGAIYGSLSNFYDTVSSTPMQAPPTTGTYNYNWDGSLGGGAGGWREQQ